MSQHAHKRRVAVLRGGPSEEYQLSLRNGTELLSRLSAESRVLPQDITITRSGEWLTDGMVRSPELALQHVDFVIIALHGTYGEDGSVQRILERLNIPYYGSAPYQSAIALHKMLTKEQLDTRRVLRAPHLRVTREGADPFQIVQLLEQMFGPQYMLKPMRSGSSFGVRFAPDAPTVARELAELFKSYDDVLVEQYIPGASVTVGVIDGFRNQSLYTTPVVEVLSDDTQPDIFAAEKIVPGRFTRSARDAIIEAAQYAHQTLGLKDISRADFKVTPEGDVYFLEINTLPAVTGDSPLVAGLTAVGASQDELVAHILKTDPFWRS